MKGDKNVYICPHCDGKTITIERDDGVTPMFLDCRATEGCTGMAQSQMYMFPDAVGEPTHEWYRPTKRERRKISYPAMRDHIEAGGLLLRKIGHGQV